MTRRIPINEWVPQGGLTLEPVALAVVKSTAPASVVAGPGAGKTELLAQRACFLLQTRTCPTPRRILAISFKRDAARTLQERVKRRAGEFAVRFDSLTFDAFAKSLLDRFRICLPEELRPPAEYRIVNWTKRDTEDFLRALKPPKHLGTTYDLVALKPDDFMKHAVLGKPLRGLSDAPKSIVAWAAVEVWRHSLKNGRLTFPMIGRLAEAILHFAPSVRSALQQTYAYVLLDEFQDTTHVQYDLTHTAFHGSPSILTAVGDHKQRIMGWAMALDDAFARFEQNFGAKPESLLMNYRSAPELVRIQEFMIKALDPEAVQPQAAAHLKDAEGSAKILLFPEHQTEARYLADMIHSFVDQEGLTPRDVCVLCKQKPDVYAETFLEELRARGIKGRIENELQDLLAEPLTELAVAHLRLATQARAPEEWELAMEFACGAQGVDPHDPASRAVENALTRDIGTLRVGLGRYPDSEQDVHAVLELALPAADRAGLKQAHLQYRHGTLFNDTLVSLREQLWASVQRNTTWAAALDDFSGVDTVPVMTIHKSKGLEYHTVIFLGLEDSAFWSFATQPVDDTCAFFVAFSRAKRRVLLTFCKQRTTSPRHQDYPQAMRGIRPLYDILRAAGVKVRRIDEWPPAVPGPDAAREELPVAPQQ
jgi:DNA helicase II / ATP-dependent DNA helicase PcrA